MSEPVPDRASRPGVLLRVIAFAAIVLPLGCATTSEFDSNESGGERAGESQSPSAQVVPRNSFWTAPLGAEFGSLPGTWVHLEEFGVFPNPRGRECYAREEDELSILGSPVEEIVYCFYEGRLVSVSAECFECDHARALFKETCGRISAEAEELSQADGYSMQTCESTFEAAAAQRAPGAVSVDAGSPATGAGALYVRTPDGEAVTMSRRHHSLSVIMERERDTPEPPPDDATDEAGEAGEAENEQ